MVVPINNASAASRFSNRAANYAKYRPGYPEELFRYIEQAMALQPQSGIVDIGSGTGLFAEPLLQNGYSVVCIEPNEEMRKAGEDRLKKYPSFQSIQSTAEDTKLAENSADLITVAQTFHWLDPVAARVECRRILKPDGHVILAWNRETRKTEFEQKYNDLRGKYRLGDNGPLQIDPVLISAFFAPGVPESKVFANKQQLDFEALKGQLLSKSYIPLPGHEEYDDMISELIKLFVLYNENGLVTIHYETLMYWGQPGL
ncbi:ubiquinone/menaquinone biosynthesis C-methylase UbiE [Filimonas zeae]|uniref:Methyltransferase n=1 Tax=Filimonas zeae TaxID=1737353 RepID=A0A917MZ16_9BACT|nr:class I SAM-dependent methyltransferase [Filimonas zeae]MDR6340534.1 ubiquinone/menaquinone biosynthesis C-methylase UbiE [Filimonas zeae]GGH73194.1 methyltransferase [Filimonas zeae]